MPITNPARALYANFDIENLDQPLEDPKGGLLAPKKMMNTSIDNMASEPAVRVGRHMLIIRKQREKLKDESRTTI